MEVYPNAMFTIPIPRGMEAGFRMRCLHFAASIGYKIPHDALSHAISAFVSIPREIYQWHSRF